MKKSNLILAVSALLILTIGIIAVCFSNVNNQTEIVYLESLEIGSDEILLYNSNGYSIGLYNLEDKNFEKVDLGQAMVFCINDDLSYLSVGNINTNDFHLLKLEESIYKSIYTENSNQISIFPLAIYDDKNIYLCEDFDSDNLSKQLVYINDDGEKQLIAETENLAIQAGLVLDEFLYVLVATSDPDVSSIYSLDLSKETQNQEFEIEIAEAYNQTSLLSYKNELLLMSENYDTLYNDYINIKLSSKTDISTDIQINEEYNLLFEFVYDNLSQKLIITDFKNETTIGVYDNVITYKVVDNQIIVYGDGYIEEIHI